MCSKILRSILERQGFIPNFGENLLKVIKVESVEYQYYFRLLYLCYQHRLPILHYESELIDELYSILKSGYTNSLLIIMMLYILDNSKITDEQMQYQFKDYTINNPELEIFLGLRYLSKFNINHRNRWFNIIKKWFELVRESNEYIYCDVCNSLMIPVFKKSDSYLCSNPSCVNTTEIYHNHCWNCGSTIDSKYDSLCGNCGWYICSECNQCRPNQYGGCDNQKPSGTVIKYKQYSSLSEISEYLNGIFINNIIKYNGLENNLINSNKYIINNCKRGKKILSTEEDLIRYLALYIPYHTVKLDSGLSSIDLESISKRKINLWDWGCGQAIGSIVFYEHIKRLNIDMTINRIVLIEPSLLSINAGKSLLNFCINKNGMSTPIIDLIPKEFDQLNNKDLNIDSEVINFHILSNILDITTFDLDRFIQIISTNFDKCGNYFLCIGPNYSNSIERIDKFFNNFSNQYTTTLIKQDSTSIKAGVYNYQRQQIIKKYITKYQIIFKTESK